MVANSWPSIRNCDKTSINYWQDLAKKFKLGQFQLVYMSFERLSSLYIYILMNFMIIFLFYLKKLLKNSFRLAQAIIIAFSMAIFFSYGLQFYVPVMILLPYVKEKFSRFNELKVEFALRFGLVMLTCKCTIIPSGQSMLRFEALATWPMPLFPIFSGAGSLSEFWFQSQLWPMPLLYHNRPRGGQCRFT